jgi:hypothetical protein
MLKNDYVMNRLLLISALDLLFACEQTNQTTNNYQMQFIR